MRKGSFSHATNGDYPRKTTGRPALRREFLVKELGIGFNIGFTIVVDHKWPIDSANSKRHVP